MITDANLAAVLASNDQTTVVEFYPSDAAPGEDGFDPADALLTFSQIAGLTFAGVSYTRRINSIRSCKRTITSESNTFSVELNNEKDSSGVRTISNFELNDIGLEGLIAVYRLISRSLSTTYQNSLILFAGRCDKPKGGSKESLTVNAIQITGGILGEMPRRKFSPNDPNGRDPSDPNFEGFRFTQQYGTTALSLRQKRSPWWFLAPIAGLLLAHDRPAKNLQYSSFSDLDVESYVPFGFGRVQVAGMHIAYMDVGRLLYVTTAFMEGKIENFVNWRTDNAQFRFIFTEHLRFGYPYGESPPPPYDIYTQVPVPPDSIPETPDWPANGAYPNTVIIFFTLEGTNADTVDEAPTVIILALAKLVATPDVDGHWSGEKWSDNPVDCDYEVLTSPHYGKLDSSWIDEPSHFETHQYNNTLIFDTSGSDVIFAPDTSKFSGGDSERSKYLSATSTVSPKYLKYLNGDATASEAMLKTAFVSPYDELVPIEPPPPGGGGDFPGGGGIQLPSLSYLLKRRYTCNVLLTEAMKIADFRHNVIHLAARMYNFQTPQGRLGLKNKKPVDFGLALGAVSGTTAEIDNVAPWLADKRGYALVDPSTPNSEVRTVTDAEYISGEAVTLSTNTPDYLTIVAFVDGDLSTNPSAASITVEKVESGELINFTLDDVEINFYRRRRHRSNSSRFYRLYYTGPPAVKKKICLRVGTGDSSC